ncbi:MAG: proline--tRNA ligase [Chloroflexi bacterium RBG_16_68_14]|nr:MAG: proline--tRNA ligase [Chloroflexi bacterium RBG_16_68_14]
MRLSHLMSRTLRQAPSEAETPSHRLLLRAGLVQQLAAGIYSFLPLGWRALRKIEQIIREEMDAAGGQEIRMPALQPVELWEASGRRETYIPPLFIVKDRRERELALGPTHEEVVTELFKQQVQSYRELPVLAYQIQTKFRNEIRARGGLIRLREFIMMDLYSFDADWEALDHTYDRVFQAYVQTFQRCGLPAIAVHADSGPIGGKDSQEFMHLTEVGEDQVLTCERCGYAANTEKADHRKVTLPPEGPLPLEEVATPGVKTIEDLARFLGAPVEKTLKAVFYAASQPGSGGGPEPVFVAIRGDLVVNETKLRNVLGGAELRLMDDREVADVGLVAGSASPIGVKEAAKRPVRVVADDSVLSAPNLIGGANKPDVHVRNVNYERDWRADVVADIALAEPGYPCPQCGEGALSLHRGIEVGHVFKLGTMYSERLGATFLDQRGQQRPAVMGCYGIGLDRLLAAVIEANHDERGIVWPAGVAPYAVHLIALSPDRAGVRDAAERLYAELGERGVEALYDDREESPGVKFADADLLGMPLRVTVSPRTLEKSAVELKRRTESETTLVPLSEAAARVERVVKVVAG